MSMRTSGGSTLCCIIRGKDEDWFIKRYIEQNPAVFSEPEYKDIKDAVDDLYMWLDCNESFICSMNANDDNGKTFAASIMRDDPYYPTAYFMPVSDLQDYQTVELPLICVYADKDCFTKSILNGGFYRNKDELVTEFKSKLGNYLPEDFDWEANIGDLEYAICS